MIGQSAELCRIGGAYAVGTPIHSVRCERLTGGIRRAPSAVGVRGTAIPLGAPTGPVMRGIPAGGGIGFMSALLPHGSWSTVMR